MSGSRDAPIPPALVNFIRRRIRRGCRIRDQAAAEAGYDGLLRALEEGQITSQTKQVYIQKRYTLRCWDEYRRQRTKEEADVTDTPARPPTTEDHNRISELIALAIRGWLLENNAGMIVKNKLDRISVEKLAHSESTTPDRVTYALRKKIARLKPAAKQLLPFAEQLLEKQGARLPLIEAVLDRLAELLPTT